MSQVHTLKDGFFLIGEDEVELALLEVGAHHLYAYGVAQLVAVVATTTYEAVVLLVEVVIVVAQVAHHDHTLAVVLVYLAIDTVGGDARDVGVIDVAYLVFHKLYHLILDRLTLGILGYLLHVR